MIADERSLIVSRLVEEGFSKRNNSKKKQLQSKIKIILIHMHGAWLLTTHSHAFKICVFYEHKYTISKWKNKRSVYYIATVQTQTTLQLLTT